MALSRTASAAKDARTGVREMQHRHYASIANIIREEALGAHAAHCFARRLLGSNPRFNERRFLTACGFPNGITIGKGE